MPDRAGRQRSHWHPGGRAAAAAATLALVVSGSLGGCGRGGSSLTSATSTSVPATTAITSTTTAPATTVPTTVATTAKTTATTPKPPGPPSTMPTPQRPETSNVVNGTAPLTDGLWFGYLRSIDAAGHTAGFDLAQWFMGQPAYQAALQDGYVQPGEPVPNDFYIRNQSQYLRTVHLAGSVTVAIIRCPQTCGRYASTVEALAAEFQAPSDPSEGYPLVNMPYWITITGGLVTVIDQQYVP